MTLLTHYKFNEGYVQDPVTAIDRAAGGSGNHNGSYNWSSGPSNGKIIPGGVGGRSVWISSNDIGSITGVNNVADLRILGELTVMFWMIMSDDTVYPIVDINGVDETSPENRCFGVYTYSNYRLRMNWEHSAGTDVVVYSSNNIVDLLDTWVHCAIVRVANGGNYNVLFYVNGSLVDTQDNGGGGFTGPDGGGNALAYIGRDQASYEGAGQIVLDSVRIYNSAESAGNILSVYNSEVAEREGIVMNEFTPTQSEEDSGVLYDVVYCGPKANTQGKINAGYTLY